LILRLGQTIEVLDAELHYTQAKLLFKSNDFAKYAKYVSMPLHCEETKFDVMQHFPSYTHACTCTYKHALASTQLQLANWVRYLDHMESKPEASVSDVAVVYESCLVPCASYPGVRPGGLVPPSRNAMLPVAQ
jgi:hypothetical protein